jgi:hypothetical protein
MHRINRSADDKQQYGFWSGNNALGRRVAIGIPCKH